MLGQCHYGHLSDGVATVVASLHSTDLYPNEQK